MSRHELFRVVPRPRSGLNWVGHGSRKHHTERMARNRKGRKGKQTWAGTPRRSGWQKDPELRRNSPATLSPRAPKLLGDQSVSQSTWDQWKHQTPVSSAEPDPLQEQTRVSPKEHRRAEGDQSPGFVCQPAAGFARGHLRAERAQHFKHKLQQHHSSAGGSEQVCKARQHQCFKKCAITAPRRLVVLQSGAP